MPRTVLASRVLAALAATALAGVGLAAAPALAAPVPATLQLSNNNDPGTLKTGSNFDVLAASVPAPCDAAATRYRLRIVDVNATNPTQQAVMDQWLQRNLVGPATAGLPGPLSVSASNTWQGYADTFGLTLVPGEYVLDLQCTNNLGTVFYEEFKGDTVTFTSPTSWVVNDVNPPVTTVATTTTVTAVPASVTTGQNVSLTATVAETDAAAPTGTVAFSVNGGTAVSAPVNASGVATTTVTAGPAGTANVSAVYSGDAKFNGSTGTTTFTVAGVVVPASATTSTLSITPAAPTAGAPVALNGTVATSTAGGPTPVGTCEFLNGSTVLGSAPVSATGTCSISRTFGQGPLSLTLRFVPANPAVFVGSTSAAVTVTVGGVSAPVDPKTDPQTVTVVIPAGQIIIQTPYTPLNPLALGTAVLAANGTSYSASAVFDRVKVIDTRAGNPGWSAFLDREDFTSPTGGTIPALNSGFESVSASYIAGNAITAITVNDVPANTLTAGPERFAQAAAGAGTGTVDVLGNFVLEGVSTSTPAGDYTATVVFTVG